LSIEKWTFRTGQPVRYGDRIASIFVALVFHVWRQDRRGWFCKFAFVGLFLFILRELKTTRQSSYFLQKQLIIIRFMQYEIAKPKTLVRLFSDWHRKSTTKEWILYGGRNSCQGMDITGYRHVYDRTGNWHQYKVVCIHMEYTYLAS
jgi:hypothetical protein